MKKSIIIFAFAILMVMSVFAANPSDVSTVVELVLSLTPNYSFGITEKVINKDYVDALTAKDITSSDIVNKISLSYDTTTYKFTGTGDSDIYYVSYLFTEYKKCKLSMYINEPLTSSIDNPTTSAKDTIQYTADFKETTVTDYTKVSSEANTSSDKAVVVKEITEDAKSIGQNTYGSFDFKISPITTEDKDNLKGKVVDTYISHVILMVTETA